MKHWLIILIFLPLLINCRKKQDAPPGNNMSFEYNGQTFSGSVNGFPILDNDYKFKGIAIQDFSIFKRVFYFISLHQAVLTWFRIMLSLHCRQDVILM